MILTQFTDPSGTYVATFPPNQAEQDDEATLRTQIVTPPLWPDPVDLVPARATLRDAREVTVKGLFLGSTADTDWQAFRQQLERIGRGYLWRLWNGQSQWCWARVEDAGKATITYQWPLMIQCEAKFRRLSPWFAATLSQVSATLTTSPQQVTVVSNGTLPVTRGITITLVATAANGYQSPTITNQTNGYTVTFAQTAAAAGYQVQFLLDSGRLLQSTNGGQTWSDVTASLRPGTAQALLFRLEPGGNVLQVSGAPRATLTIAWYDAFA